MAEAVIFDLDGLLSDTERLHRQAYQNVFSELGFQLSDREYEDHWIRAGKGITEFNAEKRLNLDIDFVRQRKARHYEALVEAEAGSMPGAVDLLQRLRGRKPMALATSSYRESAAAVVRALGIEDYFCCVAAKRSVPRAKPFPDIFLFVARTMGWQPGACVVLEDSEKGVVAANAAGMKCIAVPNVHTREHDFSKATLVISSLADISLDLIESM